MRLVLPEHRERMERVEREARKKATPLLHEDEYTQMHYALSVALEGRLAVRAYLFDPHENEILEGVPLIKSGQLCIATVDGDQEVLIEHLMRMELLERPDTFTEYRSSNRSDY